MNYLEITKSFRNKINEHSTFLIQEYQYNNDKNLWNLTCSAMDWLTVSSEYIDSLSLTRKFGYRESIVLYSFISSIDIMWEAIQQLCRVFINPKVKLYKGDKTIFNDTRLDLDDNTYFKHIRGVFGAHSVNITGDDVKRFASWSNVSVGLDYDYKVNLYSSDKNVDDVVMGFKMNQMYSFLDERLKLLDVIINNIIENEICFINKMKSTDIGRDMNDLNQLRILRDEGNLRFNLYSDTIDELEVLLNMKPIGEYKTGLKEKFYAIISETINEMYNAMQQMEYKELTSYEKCRHVSMDDNYVFSKLYEKVFTNTVRPLFEKEEIISMVKPVIILDDNVSDVELFFAYLVYNANRSN